MKLVRFGPAGREKPGIIDAKGRIRDLSKVVPDIAGDALGPKGLARIRKAAIDKLAKSNAEQVAKIRRIVEELGYEIATPGEARTLLGLKGADRVKF